MTTHHATLTATRALATVTPIRPHTDPDAVRALTDFAWDVALDPRETAADGTLILDSDTTTRLGELLPNLTDAAAAQHLNEMVDWCDQARQFADGDTGRQCQADRDDETEALDNLHRAASAAAQANVAAGAA